MIMGYSISTINLKYFTAPINFIKHYKKSTNNQLEIFNCQIKNDFFLFALIQK